MKSWKEFNKSKWNINKFFIFVSLFVLIGTTVITFITFSVNAKNNIDVNTENIFTIQTKCENTRKIIEDNKNRLVIIETHYDHIRNQLNRIEKKIDK